MSYCDTAFFVSFMTWQNIGRGRSFTQIMTYHRKTHGQIIGQSGGLIQHQHYVYTGIHFGMPLRNLWNTKQSINFWKQCL